MSRKRRAKATYFHKDSSAAYLGLLHRMFRPRPTSAAAPVPKRVTPHDKDVAERTAAARKLCVEHNRAVVLEPDRAERRRQERMLHRMDAHRAQEKKEFA